MTESTNPQTAAAEDGPLARALRAKAAAAAQAYRDFIAHVAECSDCRTWGLDCKDASDLRQTWRDARVG